MCVIAKREYKKVTAYKLFHEDGGAITPLCRYRKNPYVLGRTYSTGKPGFQAFVTEKDAEEVLADWPFNSRYSVFVVTLGGAQLGIIDNMSDTANGRAGWVAKKMKIVGKVGQ